MIGLRRRRSTQAPATRPKTKAGSSSAIAQHARSRLAEASRSRMAVKGSAVRVTSDPKVETVAAPQRWTKSAFRQRPPRCMSRMAK